MTNPNNQQIADMAGDQYPLLEIKIRGYQRYLFPFTVALLPLSNASKESPISTI